MTAGRDGQKSNCQIRAPPTLADIELAIKELCSLQSRSSLFPTASDKTSDEENSLEQPAYHFSENPLICSCVERVNVAVYLRNFDINPADHHYRLHRSLCEDQVTTLRTPYSHISVMHPGYGDTLSPASIKCVVRKLPEFADLCVKPKYSKAYEATEDSSLKTSWAWRTRKPPTGFYKQA